MRDSSESSSTPAWLLLTHQLPAEPAYLRVKVRRRLERIGAVPVKSAVYALPATDEALEDFRWLLQEIVLAGGEASLAEARFVDGTTHEQLVRRSRDARDSEYHRIASEAADLLSARELAAPRDASGVARARRLARRLEDVRGIDFFDADGRAVAERAVRDALRGASDAGPASRPMSDVGSGVGVGRTWVTRRGVKVDRIASAWLIRRFIDPEARFEFVDPDAWEHLPETLRFDMFEGEFGHVGESCTFETLLDAFHLQDPALRAVAEIVHDIDCKDDKFGRPETAGVASLVDGIARHEPDDQARLDKGGVLLDGLLEHFRVRPE